jgi:pyruvate dehydrogenase E2 component (dihydrolipoamide acetyltransferase)
MAQILGLPKLSPTMEEGVLVRWTKKEGDKVSPGDLIAEVETDKANMDFNVEDEGVLLKFLVKAGETVKLGAPVAIIGKAGEDTSALEQQAKVGGGGGGKAEAKPEPKAEKKPEPKAEPKPEAKADPKADKDEGKEKQAPKQEAKPAAKAEPAKKSPTPTPSSGKLLASPLAKSMAIELGIDLRTVTGTGPGGRIVERDVKAVADGGATKQPAEAHDEPEAEAKPEAKDDAKGVTAIAVRAPRREDNEGDYEDVATSNMRKRIAQRLTEASRDIPQFYLMRTLDVAPLLGFRERLNTLLGDKGPRVTEPSGSAKPSAKVSVNDLVIKAVALALRRVPACNASWEGDAIRHYHRVHIGVAVAIEDGLVTPVIRDADQKGIGSIAAEVRDLADRAKKRQLKGPEITGSTFTVSNLGMFGIERFTAILNPPEAGILAIGGTVDVPVVQNGQVVAGKRLTVTMTCDHRVIDGALGAKWLAAFAELLEHPESLAL